MRGDLDSTPREEETEFELTGLIFFRSRISGKVTVFLALQLRELTQLRQGPQNISEGGNRADVSSSSPLPLDFETCPPSTANHDHVEHFLPLPTSSYWKAVVLRFIPARDRCWSKYTIPVSISLSSSPSSPRFRAHHFALLVLFTAHRRWNQLRYRYVYLCSLSDSERKADRRLNSPLFFLAYASERASLFPLAFLSLSL